MRFIISHISKSRCGPPNFIHETWATRLQTLADSLLIAMAIAL